MAQMSGSARLAAVLMLGLATAVAGCGNRPSAPASDAADAAAPAAAAHTPLRASDAGVVLAIGAACKPEDGWQYTWPPAPPAPDASGPTTVPIPADYRERHQLEPGIGYCLKGTYPGGFFTSNCRGDRDCPADSRCDHDRCGIACQQDSDCRRPELYCPPRQGERPGARFCAPGCPVSIPAAGHDCYEGYGGPWMCAYPPASAGAAAPGGRTICRCVLGDLNTATWQCAPEADAAP